MYVAIIPVEKYTDIIGNIISILINRKDIRNIIVLNYTKHSIRGRQARKVSYLNWPGNKNMAIDKIISSMTKTEKFIVIHDVNGFTLDSLLECIGNKSSNRCMEMVNRSQFLQENPKEEPKEEPKYENKPNDNMVPINVRVGDMTPIESSEIKYSIVMPYYNRDILLFNTLLSLEYWYSYRKDFEVIIVEDYKNCENKDLHSKLLKIIGRFSSVLNIRILKNTIDCINPSVHFNKGVGISKGKYVILTNPEGLHMSDFLAEYDRLLKKNKNYYIVNGCINGTIERKDDSYKGMKVQFIEWYQHSIFRNANFHFCSCISKDNYIRIGGFDESYKNGYAVEDVDFVKTIQANEFISVYPADNLLVLHQAHEVMRPSNWYGSHMSNKKIFFEKWGSVPSAVAPMPVFPKK